MNYSGISDSRAKLLVKKFGEPVLVDEQRCLGIFAYPTEEQVLERSGGSASAGLVKQMMRLPDLYLHKGSGRFFKGQLVTLLDRPESPVFEIAEPDYNEDWLYRLELIEQQSAPVDTKDRKWL